MFLINGVTVGRTGRLLQGGFYRCGQSGYSRNA